MKTTVRGGLPLKGPVALAAAAVMIVVTHGPNAGAGVAPVGLLAAGLPGQFGTIKGRLVYGGDNPPAARVVVEKGKAPKDPTVCATDHAVLSQTLVVDPASKGVRHGFAYLVRPKGSNPEAVKGLLARHEKVLVDQKQCEFVPHALAIHQDQVIEFKSSDAVNHNVHLTCFTNPPFNQVMGPSGSLERKFVAERRPIALTCDIHPWMEGWIMVFDHPFFAVTKEDGSFEIKGVPAGEQKIVVWQKSVGYATEGGAQGMVVQVEADKTTDLGEIKLDPTKVRLN